MHTSPGKSHNLQVSLLYLRVEGQGLAQAQTRKLSLSTQHMEPA